MALYNDVDQKVHNFGCLNLDAYWENAEEYYFEIILRFFLVSTSFLNEESAGGWIRLCILSPLVRSSYSEVKLKELPFTRSQLTQKRS